MVTTMATPVSAKFVTDLTTELYRPLIQQQITNYTNSPFAQYFAREREREERLTRWFGPVLGPTREDRYKVLLRQQMYADSVRWLEHAKGHPAGKLVRVHSREVH